MPNRLHEFFEVQGILAMRNLTIFITIIIGSIVIIWLALIGELTAEEFGLYLFAGGGVYSFGKWQDERSRRSQIDADAEPPQVPQNVTTINQPDKVNVASNT